MSLIKKTFDTSLSHQPILDYLMSKIGFIEVDRVATGGLHSSPSLLITYQGESDKYHERGYIITGKEKQCYYHTIVNPEGRFYTDSDEFESDQLSQQSIEFDYKELGQLKSNFNFDDHD